MERVTWRVTCDGVISIWIGAPVSGGSPQGRQLTHSTISVRSPRRQFQVSHAKASPEGEVGVSHAKLCARENGPNSETAGGPK